LVDASALFHLPPVYAYLVVLSLIGGGAMAVDKAAAKIDLERISERDLALLALAGGFAGVIAVGVMIHHKTSKPDFWVPVALALVIWTIILALYSGLLNF
jgi:uncharacterized membrane protein YsdA (DUF1294 family)